MYSLETASGFLKKAHKFFRRHPDLRPNFAKIVEALKQDPFQPALKLHQPSSNMKGVYAVSLTFSYRITLTLKVTEKAIVLLDIGSHDEVYR